jgi:hypothetical protein
MEFEFCKSVNFFVNSTDFIDKSTKNSDSPAEFFSSSQFLRPGVDPAEAGDRSGDAVPR